MAEENIILNDQTLIPIMETETTAPSTDEAVLNTLNPTDNLSGDLSTEMNTSDYDLDHILSENEDVNNKETKEASNSNVEQLVESPTTGEGYVFKCVFCDQILSPNDDPKLLECLHNACAACINNKMYENQEGPDKDKLECHLCSVVCDPSKIIENQFLLELSSNEDHNNSKLAELKCSSCSDDAIASSYCTDCSEFICDNCVQAHQRLKITKDHTIKPKEDGYSEMHTATNGGPTNLFCSNHPHEKLSLFCETCDKLTCRDCQLIEHREHKYKFTKEIASDARKYISEMLKDVGYKRVLLTSAMKVIDDRQNLISEKKQALVKEITQLVVKLTNTINVKGKQLIAKLTEVCDSKQKTLLEKKQALEQLSKMTDHCIDFTQHALDNGSDMALLYSKKQVTEHLKRIKCKRADIPNPEIPVRIHLALDKVPEIMKVMSSIGQIVVDGRIYPSQSTSPSNAAPPHGSPSPGHVRPPQQQSPISPMHQQPSPSSFQAPRMPGPPPYGQNYQNNQQQYQQQGLAQVLSGQHGMGQQNMGQQHPPQNQNNQNMGPGMSQNQNMVPGMTQNQNMVHGMGQNQNMGHGMGQNQNMGARPNMGPNMGQNMGPNRLQSMGPPSINHIPQAIPISLAQQLSMGRIQRPQLQRALMPRMPSNSMGVNHQQQQVSSSTHPNAMLHDRSNLRHLLQPNNANNSPVYVQTGPSQYQAIEPHMLQNRFPNQGQMQFRPQQQNLRMLMPGQQQQQQNRMSMQQQQRPSQFPGQQQQQNQNQGPLGAGGAKWHIPQQVNNGMNPSMNNRSMTLPTINDNFKITLRQQNQPDGKNLPATVTSTIPKTPSPNHVQGRSDSERNLDKFCEESVKDLMATIAKLDSNGVQVLAEGRQKGGSPHVDSSTGDTGPSGKIKSEVGESGKDDPNEDWCAVCMDGGELVCCDKCPKVFHQYCHIPNLSVEENDTWQCLLCMNFADIPESILGERKEGELSLKERKIAERLILELYCQYDPSLPFREVIGPENVDYHAVIKNPIALDTIRQKLNWNAENHYTHMEPLIRDVRQMFKNAYIFNPEESQIYIDAKNLEKFFDEQLEKFLPEYAYENFEDDEFQPPCRKYRRILTD